MNEKDVNSFALKSGVQSHGLRIKVGKTKIEHSKEHDNRVKKDSRKTLCCVSRSGVGTNLKISLQSASNESTTNVPL